MQFIFSLRSSQHILSHTKLVRTPRHCHKFITISCAHLNIITDTPKDFDHCSWWFENGAGRWCSWCSVKWCIDTKKFEHVVLRMSRQKRIKQNGAGKNINRENTEWTQNITERGRERERGEKESRSCGNKKNRGS